MRISTILLATLYFCFLAHPTAAQEPVAAQDKDYDFRQTKWGMTKEQVIASEGDPIRDEPNLLLYVTSVAGLKTSMGFEFVDGKLARTIYALMEKYVEPNQYVINSSRWVNGLKNKYGEPQSDIQWLNDLYRSDEKKWEVAISAGHLIIKNFWETERTTIQFVISGKNFKTSAGIVYTSKELGHELDRQSKEAQKSVF